MLRSLGLRVSALLAALTRPEGAFLGLLMLGTVVFLRGWRRSIRIILLVAGVLLIGGGSYFAWHWSYFGYPLPNPFYKKGGGFLHWDSFWESLRYLVRFAGPFALAFVLGLRSRHDAALALWHSLPPLLGFAALFVLVSNETNFGGRFQYALLAHGSDLLLSLGEGLAENIEVCASPLRGRIGPADLDAHGAGRSCTRWSRMHVRLSCDLTAQQQTCGIAYEADGRYDVARLLAEYRGHDYVIATSEAGLLPLYSGWTAIDTWGLNDAWIAHDGEVTAAYLDEYRPHLIVFHAYFSPLVPPVRIRRILPTTGIE